MQGSERAVRERPILFSGPMVQGILAGRKTQTRRICKQAHDTVGKDTAFAVCPASESGWVAWFGKRVTNSAYANGFHCPHGVIGDRLWVRETWDYFHAQKPDEQAKTNEILKRFEDGHIPVGEMPSAVMSIPVGTGEKQVLYAADFGDWAYNVDSDFQWRPSIFMPRWASRIKLEIAGIRVERVEDITEEDAIAEGVDFNPEAPAALTHRGSYRKLWDKLNGKRGFEWASNPWVWVVEFRRLP